MKHKKQIETVAAAVLGIICVFLVVRMVREFGEGSAASPPARTSRVHILRARKRDPVTLTPGAELALNVQLFRQLESDPPVSVARDPFSLGSASTQNSTGKPGGAEGAKSSTAGPAKAAPPTVPLRALGFTQDRQGVRTAYFTDVKHIFTAREGQTFDKTYRVLKITPGYIEVEDEARNLRAQLTIPQ